MSTSLDEYLDELDYVLDENVPMWKIMQDWFNGKDVFKRREEYNFWK